MTQYSRIGILLLLAMALWCGAVSAVHAEDTGGNEEQVAQASLVLTKTLLSDEQLFAGDKAGWEVTLTNSGDAGAGEIQVTEIPGGLTLVEGGAVPSEGTTFNAESLVWTIPELSAGESATLTLATTIADDAAEGELQNCVRITSPTQDDPACASVEIGPTTHVEVTIKPETLNLKSRGVFTVFIRLGEDSSQSGITFGDLSSLSCGGATPTKVQMTQKDGGTLMIKYRRQTLDKDLVAKGEAVPITCEGKVSSGGETVQVTGTDTIRVLGEKKTGLDAFFSGILDTILPIEDDGGEVAGDQTATTAEPTPSPQNTLNRGQLKKAERNGDTVCTENCNAADSQDTRGNGKKAGTDGQGSVTGSGEKGNQGNAGGNGNAADNGNGNSNKPDAGKGNGKNKK